MTFEEKNGLYIITAGSNEMLERKGLEFPNRSFASQIYLGKYDKVENYTSIPKSEADKVIAEQVIEQERLYKLEMESARSSSETK